MLKMSLNRFQRNRQTNEKKNMMKLKCFEPKNCFILNAFDFHTLVREHKGEKFDFLFILSSYYMLYVKLN